MHPVAAFGSKAGAATSQTFSNPPRNFARIETGTFVPRSGSAAFSTLGCVSLIVLDRPWCLGLLVWRKVRTNVQNVRSLAAMESMQPVSIHVPRHVKTRQLQGESFQSSVLRHVPMEGR